MYRVLVYMLFNTTLRKLKIPHCSILNFPMDHTGFLLTTLQYKLSLQYHCSVCHFLSAIQSLIFKSYKCRYNTRYDCTLWQLWIVIEQIMFRMHCQRHGIELAPAAPWTPQYDFAISTCILTISFRNKYEYDVLHTH